MNGDPAVMMACLPIIILNGVKDLAYLRGALKSDGVIIRTCVRSLAVLGMTSEHSMEGGAPATPFFSALWNLIRSTTLFPLARRITHALA